MVELRLRVSNGSVALRLPLMSTGVILAEAERIWDVS